MRKILSLLILCWPLFLSAQNQTVQKPLTVTVTAHTVKLGWGASPTTQVNSYNVYRSATSGTGYVSIGSVAVPTVSFVDAAVLSGQKYYYVVTAKAPACVQGQTIPCGESGYSNEANAVLP